MGLREDDYTQGFLGFKLWVEEISDADQNAFSYKTDQEYERVQCLVD